MRTPLPAWGLMMAVALVAASCGRDSLADGNPPPTTANGSPPAVSLDGTSWLVTGGILGGEDLVPVEGRTPTMEVVGDRVSGSTGCNTYHAALSIGPDGSLAFTGFAVTEIGCEPQVMGFEAGMLAVLRAVDRFAWDGDHLTLTDGSATLELITAASEPDVTLDADGWRLTGITSGGVATSVLSGTQLSLVIDLAGGAVRGNGGCNDFGAQVRFDHDRLTISEMVSTEMACEDEIMRQEAEFFRQLASAAAWQVDGSTLTITGGEGETLTFVADAGALPERAALAWVAALAAGDLDAAAALLAPASMAYVDVRGGLGAFATELAEGWGAWDRVDDRKVWSVSGTFPDGTSATAVVFLGTVEQEGMKERRAMSLLTVEDAAGEHLVHPFTDAGRVGFVVPRIDFLDRVAPDVPFELAMPEGFEALLFLDESGPLPAEVESTGAGRLTVTALADPLPSPGEHVLTVIHLTDAGEIGTEAVIFATYP